MSWFQLAAGLIREAMNSGESTEPAQRTTPLPPADISGIVDLIDHHRAEIDKNFEAVAAMLNVQNAQRLQAKTYGQLRLGSLISANRSNGSPVVLRKPPRPW
jgi:hypothetical protein